MLFLKIIIQILTGLSSFFLITLDHYFTDKNSNSFKLARVVAMGLTILLMVSGTVVIAYDEFSQDRNTENLNTEISNVNGDLNSARDSIGTLVKVSGKVVTDTLEKLKNQLTKMQESLGPFLKIAQSKYPLLPPEMGLQRLQYDLTGIKNELAGARERKEKEDAFKKTPPNIDFGLMYPQGHGMAMFIIFKNDVPILINYAVKEVSTGKTLAYDYDGKWRINPASLANNIYTLALGDFTTNVGTRTEPFKIKFSFSYESYYYEESQDFKLKGFVEKYYMVDIQKRELKEL